MITSTRIGPGHYEIKMNGKCLGFLFDDALTRPGDREPWRFSPIGVEDGHLADAFKTKRAAIASLRAWSER